MTTAFLIGAAALGATFLLQFFFPGFMSSIMSGLSYGSVKALLEAWSANRDKRKKARQERAGAGLLGRRRRQTLEPVDSDGGKWIGQGGVEPRPAPEVDHDRLSSILGADNREPVEARHGQIEAAPGDYYPNGRTRRDARRQRRRDRRR